MGDIANPYQDGAELLNDNPDGCEGCQRGCEGGLDNRFPQQFIDIMMSCLNNPSDVWADYNRASQMYEEFYKVTGFCNRLTDDDLGEYPDVDDYTDLDDPRSDPTWC